MLSTIRVPKNLMYLTDRLPKPQYVSAEKEARKAATTYKPHLEETEFRHSKIQ